MTDRIPGIKLMEIKGAVGDDERWSSPFRWFVCLVYAGVITVLSLLPSDSLDDLPSFMPHEDKVFHFLAYALMVWAFWWALRLGGTGYVKRLFVLVFLCAVYGVLLELMQGFLQSGGRNLSLWDAVFNFAGGLAMAFVLRSFTISGNINEVHLR